MEEIVIFILAIPLIALFIFYWFLLFRDGFKKTQEKEDIMDFDKKNIENFIYKHLGFGMDEISAIWKDTPLIYRIKFAFNKKKIEKFVKKNAYIFYAKSRYNEQNNEELKTIFGMSCFTYSYYVVCGLNSILPPFFDEKNVLTYVTPAIAEVTQRYGDTDNINVLIYRKQEIADSAIKLYDDHQKEIAKQDKKWKDEFEKPFNIQKNDILSVWPARHIFLCLKLLEENDFQSEKYNISKNIYATFDFCLFAFFHTRINLCKLIKMEAVRKIEDQYFDFIVKHFSTKILSSEANAIIDSRLAEYEEIMNCGAEKSERYEDLTLSFIQFLSKDFLGSPLDKSISIIEPDETLYIADYIVNLISQLYEQTNAYIEMLQSEYGIN